MNRFIKTFLITLTLAFAFVPLAAMAAPEVKGCDGPSALCEQIRTLNQRVVELNDAKAKGDQVVSATRIEEQKKNDNRMAKVIAIAGALAVVLKMILSALASWKDYFKTDKGKAWLKAFTIVVGLLAFVAGNVGMGIPFWQALVLAGGGPGAMAVHSLMQIIPAMKGEAKMPPSMPPPADKTSASEAPTPVPAEPPVPPPAA